jgi:hypothetical protein
MKIDLDNIKGADIVYLVANTAFYVIRKLKEDKYAPYIASHLTSDEILAELSKISSDSNADGIPPVLPLILLVALSIKQDRGALLKASALEMRDNRWYEQVSAALIQQTPSIQITKIDFPAPPPLLTTTMRISPATQRVKIEVGP